MIVGLYAPQARKTAILQCISPVTGHHAAAKVFCALSAHALYRDVRAPRIYEGASEVQRTIIGRSLVEAAKRGED